MNGQAVTFVGPRRVQLANVDVPEPASGEVLIRTLFSGVSAGTELLAYRGLIAPDLPLDESISALSGTFRYPFRYGYSCVGVVERSRADHAEGALVFAFHPHQDRFVARAADVVPVDSIEPRIATLFPLVETALQIALDAGAVLEQHVIVLGLGAVGILTAALLRRAGARVIGVDRYEWRRDAAGEFGIRAVDPADLGETAAAASSGAGVPLVIEVTGNPDALVVALPLLAHEGHVLVASWYGVQPVALPLGAEFHRRRLVIRSTQVTTIPAALTGSWTVQRRREVVRSLLDELPMPVLATHVFPFSKAPAAYAEIDRQVPGMLHTALSY
jgi:2-desacetyl-2-hydroxyethyl bacteriochlorophyllide A dehydrogenase